jgi:hypothetical protein
MNTADQMDKLRGRYSFVADAMGSGQSLISRIQRQEACCDYPMQPPCSAEEVCGLRIAGQTKLGTVQRVLVV